MSAHAMKSVLLAALLWTALSCAASHAQQTPEAPAGEGLESVVRTALDHRVESEFVDLDLEIALAILSDECDVPIRLDRNIIPEARSRGRIRVTVQPSRARLQTVLDLMFEPLDLDYVIRDDILLVTTRHVAEEYVATKVYDVADLGPFPDVFGSSGDDPLVEVIANTIAPTTWEEVGGPGSIRRFASFVSTEHGMRLNVDALVVSQTWRVHRQIESLLGELRAVRRNPPIDPQVPPAEKRSEARRAWRCPAGSCRSWLQRMRCRLRSPRAAASTARPFVQ